MKRTQPSPQDLWAAESNLAQVIYEAHQFLDRSKRDEADGGASGTKNSQGSGATK